MKLWMARTNWRRGGTDRAVECRPVVADSHHFDEEQDLDPDPHYSEKSDQDPP